MVPAGVACGKLDLKEIPENEKIVSDALAWIKFDVEDKLVLHTGPGDLSSRPHAIIKFSSPCYASVCAADQNVMRGMNVFLRNLNQPDPDPDAPNADPHPRALVQVNQNVVNAMEHGRGGADMASLNDLNFQPPIVYPISAVIPLKSSIKTYGPWASSNFSTTNSKDGGVCGGIKVENNPDLAPWIFGSTLSMHNIGLSLVEYSNIGLTRSETGSITLASLPSGFAYVGAALANSGPTLTGMNFTFGQNGISTTYEFKTYTPKFGKLSKLYIDKFKEVSKKRSEQLRFLKNQAVQQNKSARRIRNIQIRNAFINARHHDAIGRQASLQRVMVGEMYNFYDGKTDDEGPSQRTVVGTDTLSKSINEMVYDYSRKAFISLDGLYSPVTINGDGLKVDSGIMPRFISAVQLYNHHSSPIHAQPPFTTGECDFSTAPGVHDQYNLTIHNMYLNPLANPNSIPHISGATHQGHSIELVGRENDIPESGSMACLYTRDDPDKYSSDYRFLGLRGPLVLHSWGYDVDGKPIPNLIDQEDQAKSGIFVAETGSGSGLTGLKDQFLPNWLQKPATWPVGPVDLRFDRDRGVWVTPQPFKIVVAQLKTDIEPWGDGAGIIINIRDAKRYGKKLFDENGHPVKENNPCVANCERGALRVLTNLTFSEGCGLVAETAYVRVTSIRAGDDIVIPVTSCSGGPIDCSSSSNISSSSSSCAAPTGYDNTEDYPRIKIVDRLGIDHYKDDMAYVYYDTYEAAYVILQSNTLNW